MASASDSWLGALLMVPIQLSVLAYIFPGSVSKPYVRAHKQAKRGQELQTSVQIALPHRPLEMTF